MDALREAGLRAIADHIISQVAVVIISQVAVVTEDRDWLHGLLVKAAREGADLERQAEERRLLENYLAARVGRIPELVRRLLAERDALRAPVETVAKTLRNRGIDDLAAWLEDALERTK